jgi:hypothetical protein
MTRLNYDTWKTYDGIIPYIPPLMKHHKSHLILQGNLRTYTQSCGIWWTRKESKEEDWMDNWFLFTTDQQTPLWKKNRMTDTYELDYFLRTVRNLAEKRNRLEKSIEGENVERTRSSYRHIGAYNSLQISM